MSRKPHDNFAENKRFEALIVFGYGPVLSARCRSVAGRLNEYGRITALGAGMLYQKYYPQFIIPTGGKTGGLDKPSEAELIVRMLRSRFGIPENVFIIEDKATNTIQNVIYSANIIDRLELNPQNLLLIAMGFHIQRIKEISAIVGLSGKFVAAEKVVERRSQMHRKLLSKLLSPERERYAKVLAEQQRWLRGLREIPEYWLPEMAKVENESRLMKILREERIQPFLQLHGIDPDRISPDELRMWLRKMPRKFPAP